MKIKLMNQFGPTGVADAGVTAMRVQDASRLVAALMATPDGVPGLAGDEQLR